tara:strand:+ start:107 stop:430 length:324 start_codon:yes stop_codon:yes gene_type:complete
MKSFLLKVWNLIKKIGIKIKDLFVWLYLRFMRFFEDHKYLHVTHTKYDSEGAVVETLIKSFTVRKFYKCTNKHIKFKTYDGTLVELKTATPMDYMTETIVGEVKTFE